MGNHVVVAMLSLRRVTGIRIARCSHLARINILTAQFATSALPNNPLLDHSSPPRFKTIEPSHVQPAIEHLVGSLEHQLQQLEARISALNKSDINFSNTVEAVEKVQHPLFAAWGIVGHLNGVQNSEALREAHAAMQPEVVRVTTKMGKSKPLFDALEVLEQSQLDPVQTRIVQSSLRGMRMAGVGLDGAAKTRFNEIKAELSQLSTDFSNNVLDATKEFKLKLTEPEQVDGLPPSGLALAAQTAADEGDTGATAADGPWMLTLAPPSYIATMKHLKDEATRETVYRAFISRAGEQNGEILEKILSLRLEQATILGYSCYADISLSSKMAPDVAAVDLLTQLLSDKALVAAKGELAEVQSFADQQRQSSAKLCHWDMALWSEQQREAQYGFSDEELRPYFALPAVLDGLFSLIDRLFGVTIKRADGDAEVWHPDVQFFHLEESTTGNKLASFYLDPYSRPADKRGGAWMADCVGKSRALQHDTPVAYLTCNGSPPVGDLPSLMTFSEVETLFHEMGHGLQHMLTKVEDGDASGINNVEWDAVELPSQFMENWLYDQRTLYGFAKHHETGEPLPDHYFDKLRGARVYQAGLAMTRQLYFQSTDLELHSRYLGAEASGETPFDVQQRMAKRHLAMPPLEEDRFLAAFSHIFAGGYAAGYYSYKWAEVMSADAFGAFEDAGLDDEVAVQATGRRFRDTVLALGGGTAPMDVYVEFRGREPTPD